MINNYISCTINGIIANDFKYKNINNKSVYQSKLFFTNINIKKDIIDILKKTDNSIPSNIKSSNKIIINIWDAETYEQFNTFLKKGSSIEATGILKYKIYNKLYGGQKLEFFFNIHSIFKIKESLYKNKT